MEEQTQRTGLRTWERGGESEMYGESNRETYTTICKIDSQWEFAIMSQGSQTGALYQPRGVGWGGRLKREGKYAYIWLIHAEVSQKAPKFCKHLR